MYLFRSPRWASVKRMGYTVLGVGIIIVAIVPVVVPSIIAVPLAILGSLYLAKGIPSIYEWCMNHPLLGKWLRNLKTNGLTRRQQLLAVLGATICYAPVLYFDLSDRQWTIAGWCSTTALIFIPHHWFFVLYRFWRRLMGRLKPRP